MAEHSGRRVVAVAERSTGLAAVVAVAAICLAACGGSSSPQVASLATSSGNSSGRSTTTGSGSATAVAKGDPTRLLDGWATCMRAHGDPNQADPSIDAYRDIVITLDGAAIPGGYNGTNEGGQGNLGPGQFCRAYLEAAQLALQGGHRRKPPDQATVEKLSECMRANGIPDFPDPTANGLQISGGGDLSGGNPTFQNASKVCSQRTGGHWPGAGGTPPAGVVKLNGAGPPGGGGSGGGG